jgi:hypothetical protein
MGKTTLALILSALVLSGCAAARESRLNPFNWFGGDRAAAPVASEAVNPLIPVRRASLLRDDDREPVYAGTPVAEVAAIAVDRRPGGAILRATGVAAASGAYDVRLVPDADGAQDGTLDFALSAVQPGLVGGPQTVEVAVFLSDQDLAGIRQIRVSGTQSARVVRR